MSLPFQKSTVQARKSNPKAGTQRHLPIAEIRNDTVLLKNGGIRAVLEVEAVNFNLKSETEQQGIIAGYGSFVNTLTFPLQVVIRSLRTNIDAYLVDVRAAALKHENTLLKEQTLDYASFMERLIEAADIMQKRFYVIVPMDHTVRQKTILEKFFEWMHPEDSAAKATHRNREFTAATHSLQERVELIETGLNNIGLHTRRLPTRELLALYYQIYNPKTSQHEKMPEELEQLHIEKTVL